MRRLLLAFAALVLATQARAEALEVPLVELTYSFDFDESCAGRVDSRLDTDAVDELERLMPELEAAWSEDGPALLQAAREAVGRPFGFRKTTARLLTCDVASRSRPLVINVRPYLRATAGRRRVALRQFASTVVHEVLHRYVSDLIAEQGLRETRLLRKYADEPQEVLDHLHVFAIEEVAYAAAGREGDLEDMKAFESRLLKARMFARSRRIVQAEGAEAFLAELRQAP